VAVSFFLETVGGVSRIYQEGALGDNLDVLYILNDIPTEDGLERHNICSCCGTFAAKGGTVFGELFEFEMEDPVLGR